MRPKRAVDHPPPPSAVVNERVELNFYFPFVPLWLVVVCSLPYLYLYLCLYFISEVTGLKLSGVEGNRVGQFHESRKIVLQWDKSYVTQ
jgi:hypothetical protein